MRQRSNSYHLTEDDNNTGHISVTVSGRVGDKFKRIAKHHNRNAADLLDSLLLNYVERWGPQLVDAIEEEERKSKKGE